MTVEELVAKMEQCWRSGKDPSHYLRTELLEAERRGLTRAAVIANAYDGKTAKDIAAHIEGRAHAVGVPTITPKIKVGRKLRCCMSGETLTVTRIEEHGNYEVERDGEPDGLVYANEVHYGLNHVFPDPPCYKWEP